jgi:SAM-dependent methyltransferase
MIDPNALFTGGIPENYDRHLGKVLFEPYAADLVGRLDAREGARVLEIACGTGIVTRYLRNRIPASGRLVATDLNPPMIDFARQKLVGMRGIDWRPADACALPFPSASFDAVVCQFGLMFVPDKSAAFHEARRVLAAGGAFLFNVWDSLERNAFARIAHETIASFFPADPPTFYQVPFSLHRREELEAFLSANDFGGRRIEEVALEGQSPSAGELAIGLVEGNPTATTIRERGNVPVGRVIDAVATALAREFGDRPVRLPLKALVVSARAGAGPQRV